MCWMTNRIAILKVAEKDIPVFNSRILQFRYFL